MEAPVIDPANIVYLSRQLQYLAQGDSVPEPLAERLGNTPAVCRKCYIHPAILAAYMDGKPMATDEAGVAAMIGRRLRKTA